MGGVIAINKAIANTGKLQGLAIWNSNLMLGSLATLLQGLICIEKIFKSSPAPSSRMRAPAFDRWGKQVKGGLGGFDW